MRFCLLSVLLILTIFRASGSENNVDSLAQSLQRIEGQAKTETMLKIALLIEHSDPIRSQAYVKEALAGPEQYRNDSLDKLLNASIGRTSFTQNRYLEARQYFTTALRIASNTLDTFYLAICETQLGKIDRASENYEDALDHFKSALQAYDQLANHSESAAIHNHIGSVYYDLKRSTEALTHFETALSIYEKSEMSEHIFFTVRNISEVLVDQQEYQKAIYFNTQALANAKVLGYHEGTAIAYSEIGHIHKKSNNLEKATDFLNQAATEFLQINDLHAFAKTNTHIAQTLLLRNKHKAATNFLSVSMIICDSLNYDVLLTENLLALAQAQIGLGQNKYAEQTLAKRTQITDSLARLSKTDKMSAIASKYANDLKIREIKSLKQSAEITELEITKEADRSKYLTYVVTSLVIGGSCSVILLLLVFKQVRKINKINETISEYNDSITDSIQYASSIQKALLPSTDKLPDYTDEHFVINQPKDIVSGDLHWIEECDNKLIVAAIDCTGHGVPGAMMSVLANNILTNLVKEKKISDPGLILNELNERVKRTLHRSGEQQLKDGMEIAICVCEPNAEHTKITFASANRPIFIASNKKHYEVVLDKLVIGGFTPSDHKFMTKELNIYSGESIYLFSDGFTDQFGGDRHRKFSKARLYALLSSNSQLQLTVQRNLLKTALEEWQEDNEQTDDILMLGLRF